MSEPTIRRSELAGLALILAIGVFAYVVTWGVIDCILSAGLGQ